MLPTVSGLVVAACARRPGGSRADSERTYSCNHATNCSTACGGSSATYVPENTSTASAVVSNASVEAGECA